jgi:hypothetical protein
MRKLALSLALTLPCWAEEPPGLAFPGWQRSANGIKLVCAQKPSAVYFRRSPERLVIEFAGVQMQGTPPGAPSVPGIRDVHWRQPDISHAVCEVGLAYRVPATQVKPLGDGLEIALNYEWEDQFKLTPAVIWKRFERAQGGRYLLWNELQVDPSDPAVGLEVGLAKDRVDSRERTTDMVSRLGALAGVNGGYFADSGGPLGVVFRGGKLVSPHVGRRPPRTTLGVMKDRRIEMDQMVAQKGQLASRSGETWGEVELALGGGPRLLRRGRVALTTDEEELGPKGNDITRITSRTAVATTRDGRILIVAASGYQDNHMQGLRLEELAGELLRRGGSEAMNLDGGASTTMAIGNQVVSRGPGAPRLEKAVATTLLVRDGRGGSAPARVQLRCTESELPADGASKVVLEASVRDAAGRPVPDGTPVRFFAERLHLFQSQATTEGGVARVQGLSLASAGESRVYADCGGFRGEAEMQLVAGPVARLWTRLLPVASTPGKFSLTVQAVDRWKSPVKNCSICLGEGAAQLSGANGQTTFELVRPPGSAAGSVLVSCEGGPSLQVPVPAVEMAVPPVSPPAVPAATPTPPHEGEEL